MHNGLLVFLRRRGQARHTLCMDATERMGPSLSPAPSGSGRLHKSCSAPTDEQSKLRELNRIEVDAPLARDLEKREPMPVRHEAPLTPLLDGVLGDGKLFAGEFFNQLLHT